MDVSTLLKERLSEKLKDFSAKLLPGTERERILGVKVPELRKLAKEITNSGDYRGFLEEKHYYLEETLLHGLILGYAKLTTEALIGEIEKFLPLADNWMVTDCTASGLKAVKKNRDAFYLKCLEWLESEREYTVRFAVVVLLGYYLDDDFRKDIPALLARYDTDSYYINMAIAWYFSVALVKHYDEVIGLFRTRAIVNPWVHNKSIQKAVESYRISDERKAYLKSLKMKEDKKQP